MNCIGASHHVWLYDHQVSHHMSPNIHGKDNDFVIGNPFLRFNPSIKLDWMHKYQHILTFVGMTFGTIKWIASDFECFINGAVGSIKFRVNRVDWAVLALFKTMWATVHLVIPLYLHGAKALWLFFLFMGVGAHYLENIFIVNHIQHELYPTKDMHWAAGQVAGTANWCAGSKVANFVSGGLNHQIEHHLFPAMNIYLYPAISPIVRQTCEEFKLPYKTFPSFGSAWLACYNHLKTLGQVASY
jgi:fatty acid desaturase